MASETSYNELAGRNYFNTPLKNLRHYTNENGVYQINIKPENYNNNFEYGIDEANSVLSNAMGFPKTLGKTGKTKNNLNRNSKRKKAAYAISTRMAGYDIPHPVSLDIGMIMGLLYKQGNNSIELENILTQNIPYIAELDESRERLLMDSNNRSITGSDKYEIEQELVQVEKELNTLRDNFWDNFLEYMHKVDGDGNDDQLGLSFVMAQKNILESETKKKKLSQYSKNLLLKKFKKFVKSDPEEIMKYHLQNKTVESLKSLINTEQIIELFDLVRIKNGKTFRIKNDIFCRDRTLNLFALEYVKKNLPIDPLSVSNTLNNHLNEFVQNPRNSHCLIEVVQANTVKGGKKTKKRNRNSYVRL